MIDSMTAEVEVLEFLATLVTTIKPRLVVETGSFLGVSTEWIARGLERNGFGKVISCEFDPVVYEKARARFADAAAAGVFADAGVFIAAMERIAPYDTPRPAVVVHGDLYARHLLVDDAGALAGVIDWGDVHLGDPALDLAAAKLVLPPTDLDTFLAHYGAVDATTWDRATYRAIHHAALELAYGIDRNDHALIDAARFALAALREQL